jgi:hypothetical protein
MARVDHLAGGIYRISTYAPAKRISFNQFLIQDEKKSQHSSIRALFRCTMMSALLSPRS